MEDTARPAWLRALVPPVPSDRVSAALLVIRLVAGIAFILHGWSKIQNPFGWMGPQATIPGILQGAAALSEFGGGIAWILGLLTPLASLGLFSTMAFAAYTHISRGDPFVGRGGSWELAALYAAIALVLLLAGPGRFSADEMLFRRRAASAP
jgi:putative oxidoreductase